MKAKEVVEIPGFNNFSEFSLAYQEEIQRCLEATQIIEGVFMFSWINGLAGLPKVSAKRMRKLMDEIFDEVSKNGIAYVKLQTPGIDSHAWLITEMEKISPNGTSGQEGYAYKFIDSNYPGETIRWIYNQGDTQITLAPVSVPYLQRSWELLRMYKALQKYTEDFA